MPRVILLLAAVLPAAASCHRLSESADGGAADTDEDGAADTDADADSDTDTAGDTDTFPDTDSSTGHDCTGEGVWYDDTTTLCWQAPYGVVGPDDDWWAHLDYCEDLTLAGFADWRLPSISEFRSLIRGCWLTETGGLCNVTDEMDDELPANSYCDGCTGLDGPAPGGCYYAEDWPEPAPCQSYWFPSSTTDPQYDHRYWAIKFDDTWIYSQPKETVAGVCRCVRTAMWF